MKAFLARRCSAALVGFALLLVETTAAARVVVSDDGMFSVDLGAGASAVSLAAGGTYTCAWLADGRLKCWGANIYGSLGLGDNQDRGGQPNQMGDALPAVDIGPTH